MSVETLVGSAVSTSLDSDEDDDDLPKVLEVNEVRITPPHMRFDNAYEGKSFEEKLVIQNCGNKSAIVRLCEPSSSTFVYKSFTEGVRLCPGHKIIRKVSYTYRRAIGTLKGFTSIWVNDDEVEYHFVVYLSRAKLSVKPSKIDFGTLDINNHATTRTFKLQNTGYKGTVFAVDLPKSSLELNVYPLKGSIPGRTSISICVELVGSRQGRFIEEFWIKADPPLRIVVTVTFIKPKLVVPKFIRSLDFTLVDYEPTYYGSATSHTVGIKNSSSINSMFCVMAEVKGKTMTIEEALKIDDNYKNFKIQPLDGRLQPLKMAYVDVTFSPIKTGQKDPTYATCFLKLIRLECSDIKEDIYTTPPLKIPHFDFNNSEIDSITGSVDTALSVTFRDDPDIGLKDWIEVCLYGEKEVAGVTFRPTELHLTELTLDCSYQRELLVINQSKKLPIGLRYNKTAAIDVKPPEFDVRADGSTEVLVTMRTMKLDVVVKAISFDLIYKNNKVGTVQFKISCEAITMKKTKSTRCRGLRETDDKLESDFPYRLTEEENAKRLQQKEYYTKYIRSLRKSSKVIVSEDYDVSESTALRSIDKCRNLSPARLKVEKPFTAFIPLPPRLLYNIRITPTSIKLQKVAAYTTISNYFEIQNLNTFPIRIFTKASKPCIVFHNSRYIIRSKHKEKISFSFSTTSIGKYLVNISILVNDSTLFEVTVVAQVVPKVLSLSTYNLEFTEKDDNFKFFTVTNTLNSYINFKWDVPNTSFTIYPQSGGIQPDRRLMCMVTYTPSSDEANNCDCVLTSESGHKRILNVSYKERCNSFVFDNYCIDMGRIPLNVLIRKHLILRNLKNVQILFRVPNQISVPGIIIEPSCGQVDGLDSQVFVIRILVTAVIEFSTDIIFDIDGEDVAVNLRGAVAYPAVIIHPSTLNFRKIAAHSFDTLAFKVKNASPCEVSINFPLEQYPEFSISAKEEDTYSALEKMVLQPDQSKILFLHFHPLYVSSCSLKLPYVLNNILGPTHISSNDMNRPAFFLDNNMQVYKKVKDVTITPLPRSLPVMRIGAIAPEERLVFSNLNMKFIYYGREHYNNSTSAEFEISSKSSEVEWICIRTDDLQHPFSLMSKNDCDNIEFYDVSYKICLAPNEKIVFHAEFFPSGFGEYKVRLPIFLRNYHDNKIFNYITLQGVFGQAEIIPAYDRFNFEPIPVRLTNFTRLTLRLKNHSDDCSLYCETEMGGLYAIFETECKVVKGEALRHVALYLEAIRPRCFETQIIFMCTCNARCVFQVTGVAENCLLTTHAYSHMLMKKGGCDASNSVPYLEARSYYSLCRPRYVQSLVNHNTTCFPLFPAADDNSEYAQYMRSLVKTLETWLYSQGFYMKSYYKIPDGFRNFCRVDKPREEIRFGGFRKQAAVPLPLLQLVRNFVGPKIDELFQTRPPDIEDGDKAWLVYIYKIRSTILRILREHSAYIPHVKTKYLFNYKDYFLYEKGKHPNVIPMNRDIFYRLSKQCWVDLILQIIKVFFFYTAVPPPLADSDSISETKRRSMNSRMSAEDLGEDILELGIYGERESVLIVWLQYRYDMHKDTIWEVPPADKLIVYLDEDLRDGLILGTVTAYYCPYIVEHIKEMYSRPKNPEEFEHNCYVLISVWKMLKLSYIISPLSMRKSNMVEMLLLVTYLYHILPTCTASDEITIEAPLTQTRKASFDLKNLGDDPIHYELVFFGNKQKLFTAPGSFVVVPPKSSRSVKVHYHAKFVHTQTVTLMFSGETPGQKYGKNLVVTVIGSADVSYSCMEIPITVDLYKPCQVAVTVQSPFKVAAEFTPYFGYEHISKDRNVLFALDEIQKLKTIQEIVINDNVFRFDEEGRRTTIKTLCCQKVGPRNLWFYFSNPEIGDFGIKIILTGRVTELCYENVNVEVPRDYKNLPCTCKRAKSVMGNCPKIIHVKLPMMNEPLWHARKTMVLWTVRDAELGFWSKRIFTPLGTRILKLILNSETHPLGKKILETVEYTTDSDPSLFVTLHKVTFEDVTSDDYYLLPIHPIKDVNKLSKCMLRLVSTNQMERRFFRLHFSRD